MESVATPACCAFILVGIDGRVIVRADSSQAVVGVHEEIIDRRWGEKINLTDFVFFSLCVRPFYGRPSDYI